MRDLDDDRAEELGPGRSELQNSAGDGLALHQRRGMDQFVLLQISRNTPGQTSVSQLQSGDQPARHSHRHRSLPGRDDDPDP